MGRWTDEETAVLMKNRQFGPTWDGWARLLPGRTPTQIMSKRKQLGITFAVGEKGAQEHRGWTAPQPREPKKARRKATPWTDAQRVAAVRHCKEMVDESGHTLAECLREVARLVRARGRA